MLHTKLTSTAIESMEYNRKSRTLKVTFVTSPTVVYEYANVSRYMADVLRFAEAPGRVFGSKIRNRYAMNKVVA